MDTTGDSPERPSAEQKRELEQLMHQYYALDHEDTIDDIKCRYRYIKVISTLEAVHSLSRYPRMIMDWSLITFYAWMINS